MLSSPSRWKAALAGLACSAALAFDDDPARPFETANRRTTEIHLNWITAADVRAECARASRARGFQPLAGALQACSFWEGDRCTIVTGRSVSMHTLGHELRHCFFGNWHP